MAAAEIVGRTKKKENRYEKEEDICFSEEDICFAEKRYFFVEKDIFPRMEEKEATKGEKKREEEVFSELRE